MAADFSDEASKSASRREERRLRLRREKQVLSLYSLGLGGLAILAVGAFDLSRSMATVGWIPAEGIVVKTEVREYTTGRRASRKRRTVDVTYRYEVDGNQYSYTDRYPKFTLLLDGGFLRQSHRSQASAQSVAGIFRKDASVRIVHNPKAPDNSRIAGSIERRFRTKAIIEVAVGLVVSLFGIGGARLLKLAGYVKGSRLERPVD